MINPYPSRMEELHAHLAAHYGQKDRQATEALLCGLLPASTGAPLPWFVIETDWPSHDTTDAWFSFGLGTADTPVAKALAVPRTARMSESARLWSDWADERAAGHTGLYVDGEWASVYAGPTARGRGRLDTQGWRRLATDAHARFMSLCLHLRVEHPRSDRALRTPAVRLDERNELARLTRRVLDPAMRTDRQTVDNTTGARALLYWCELLERLAPWQTDWEALTGGLAACAFGTALLWNDGRPADWTVAERLMRDSVHTLTRRFVEAVAEAQAGGEPTYRPKRGSGVRATRTDMTVTMEVKRLVDARVLVPVGRRRTGRGPTDPPFGWNDPHVNRPWRYRLAGEDYATLLDRSKRILV